MANVDAAFGFRPSRHMSGAPYNGQYQTFLFDSGDSTACHVGDVVKWAGSSGVVGQTVAGMDVEGVATVTKATGGITAGTGIAGVVVGFSPDPTDLSKKHRAASTNRLAYVVTDPTVVYEVQSDEAGSVLAATSVGLNAGFQGGTGSDTTGVSGAELDSSTALGTLTLPLRILGLTKRPGNSWNTAGVDTDNAKIDVVFNASGLATGVAGV